MASVQTRAAVGGLLSGFGKGLVQRANDQREMALLRLQRDWQQEDRRAEIAEQQRREGVTSRENRRQEEARAGLLSDTFIDPDNNVIGVTGGGQRINLGPSLPDRDTIGLTANDKRTIDIAIEARTTEDPVYGTSSTDWARVREDLQQSGRPDLAAYIQSSGGRGSTIDTQSDEWQRAEQLAEEWIKDQTTMLGRDKDELAEYGGNRTQARLAKTQEFYQQLTGETTAPRGSSSQNGPTGMGSADNPHRPTTQAEFDRLPSGAVYLNPADGQLYRKN